MTKEIFKIKDYTILIDIHQYVVRGPRATKFTRTLPRALEIVSEQLSYDGFMEQRQVDNLLQEIKKQNEEFLSEINKTLEKYEMSELDGTLEEMREKYYKERNK